jgi:Putative Flp pilus-assembly TadE/G-like
MKSRAHETRPAERGQTIILVVFSAFALLAMTAIAIDVVTLYVARNEAQRAADAAALAGAKAFVSTGYTSNLIGFSGTVCSGGSPGTGLADQQAQATLASNPVLGVAPTLTTSCNLGTGGTLSSNPQITATVTRANLPIFFAKVLGVFGSVAVPSATATATAEAYNPSNGVAPIQVSGVKPWLIPDCPPSTSPPPNTANCATPYFVDVNNGSIVNSGAFIGTTIYLSLNSGGNLNVTTAPGSPTSYEFYPLSIPISPPTPMCASTTRLGCTNAPGPYYDNIACFNPFTFQCGQQIGPTSTPSIPIDNRIWTGFLQSRTDQGTQCLIHTNASVNYTGSCSAHLLEQDCFSPQGVGKPVLIQPGSANPDPSFSTVSYISRSDSVVTVPLFDGGNLCSSNPCSGNATVVGFLQLGIIQDGCPSGPTCGPGPAKVQAIILNASGCNTGATAPPVSGGGVSPIPVRLIQ